LKTTDEPSVAEPQPRDLTAKNAKNAKARPTAEDENENENEDEICVA
jgi:hypothetical protein